MKRGIYFAVLLLILDSAYSLSLSSNYVLKGDSVLVYGLEEGEKVDIYIDEEYYSSFVATTEELYYNISLLDPSGEWRFVTSNESARLMVRNSYQSKELLLTFISPINSSSYFVGSDMEFKVNVTKNLVPVSNITCYLFYSGNYVKMDSNQSICTYTLFIPPNQTIGAAKAVVIASDGKSGGEESIFFNLKRVPIDIELLEPKFQTIRYGDSIRFSLNLSYKSGYSVDSPTIEVKINGEPIDFDKVGSIIYFNYSANNTAVNLVNIEVLVVDEYGNSGEFIQSFELTGKNAYLLSKYKWHLILLGASIVIVFYVIFALNYKRIRLIRLERRKAELIELEKKIQTEYYKLGTIDYDTYEETMEEYNLELSKIKEEIKRLKKGGK